MSDEFMLDALPTFDDLEGYETDHDTEEPSETIFAKAVKITDSTGIVEAVQNAVAAERRRVGTAGMGGRPRKDVSVRAIIIGFHILAMEHKPLHQLVLAQLFCVRLSTKQRLHLGLGGKNKGEDTRAERRAMQHRINRAWSDMTESLDPFHAPAPRRQKKGGPAKPNRRTKWMTQDWEAHVAKLDPAVQAEKTRALQQVANLIIEGSHFVLPLDYRHKNDGHFAIDGTAFATFGRGTNRNVQSAGLEPAAAWYRRDGDHKADASTPTVKKALHGYEASIIVAAKKRESDDLAYPLLAYALTLGAPGTDIARLAVQAVESMVERGHDVDLLVADRLYFAGQAIEKLHLPLRKLGLRFVTDYRKDQLGAGPRYEGFQQVEGHWYCPSMPQRLVDITLKLRTGMIGYDEWQEGIADRAAYAASIKQRPNSNGDIRLQCPASRDASSTVRCPLRPDDSSARRPELLMIQDPPDRPAKGCKQKTITVPAEEGLKLAQDIRFGVEEWLDAYGCGRNGVESFNASLKDGSRENLGQADRRRMRGFASQYLLVSFLVASVNIRKINSFVEGELDVLNGRPPKKPTRRSGRDPFHARFSGTNTEDG